jgi:hypothetical protein
MHYLSCYTLLRTLKYLLNWTKCNTFVSLSFCVKSNRLEPASLCWHLLLFQCLVPSMGHILSKNFCWKGGKNRKFYIIAYLPFWRSCRPVTFVLLSNQRELRMSVSAISLLLGWAHWRELIILTKCLYRRSISCRRIVQHVLWWGDLDDTDHFGYCCCIFAVSASNLGTCTGSSV